MKFALLVVICVGIGLLWGFEPTHAQAMPTSITPESLRLSPASGAEKQEIGDTCVTDFPRYTFVHFLPLIITRGRDAVSASSTWRSDVPLAKQTGSLVPLGDQLGDVGQYYSQIAPSLASTLTLENASSVTQTFDLKLLADTGAVARSLRSCSVAPNATLALQIKAGQIWIAVLDQQVPMESICEPSIAQPESTGQAPPNLHGVYHAELTTNAQNPFTITVATAADDTQPSILHQTNGHYRAIPEQHAQSIVHLPALVATRDQDSWWDTELVVQNVTNRATNVQFQLCDDQGRCFANNLATLNGRERRIFLASHLLYADDAGFLAERAGWFSATLTATPADGSGDSPKVVVLTNIFQQKAAAGFAEPQAEQGSSCLLQVEPMAMAQQIEYIAAASNELVLRVYNPGNRASAVQVQLIDGQGRSLKTVSGMSPAGGSSFWFIQDILSSLPAVRPGETMAIQVQAQQAVVAFAWQNGRVLRPLAAKPATATWYAPLIAAPTIPFRWDNSTGDASRSNHPGADFGLAETRGEYHAQRPVWARRLNWYTWSAAQEWCNETVDDSEPYSTFIPMWWGLGACTNASNDRSCVNSPSRLQKLRNDIPSSCVGRPLFLANEPDLPAPQSYMTYHELGRLIYQLRSWPGELYSPVFASHAYDAPTYITEPTPWCAQAVQNGWCPGADGCTACIQDGMVDGSSDPHDISFKGLEDYFAAEGRWVRGESWRFEDTIEGMLLHYYTMIEPFASDSYWRAPYLQQYRDRADQAGWPIIVNEYGFVIWPDHLGVFPDISACTVSHYADDLRRVLQKHLGGHQPEHGYNPKKLFWYHTGCFRDTVHRSENLCLFQDPISLSSPVGICWHDDAARGGREDSQCNQPCTQTFLPFVKP